MMGVTKHACQFSLRACAVVTATVKKINKIFHGDWCNQRQQHRESSGWWENRTSLAWSNRWCRRGNARRTGQVDWSCGGLSGKKPLNPACLARSDHQAHWQGLLRSLRGDVSQILQKCTHKRPQREKKNYYAYLQARPIAVRHKAKTMRARGTIMLVPLIYNTLPPHACKQKKMKAQVCNNSIPKRNGLMF